MASKKPTAKKAAAKKATPKKAAPAKKAVAKKAAAKKAAPVKKAAAKKAAPAKKPAAKKSPAKKAGAKKAASGGIPLEIGTLSIPAIVEISSSPVAMIAMKVPKSGMQKAMGPAMRELNAAIAKQGRKATGPMFCHHLELTPTHFNFEVSRPVDEAIAEDGRVKPSSWPTGKMLRAEYHGPYEGYWAMWPAFDGWAEKAAIETADDLYEIYLTTHETEADPSKWCTVLMRPLAS